MIHKDSLDFFKTNSYLFFSNQLYMFGMYVSFAILPILLVQNHGFDKSFFALSMSFSIVSFLIAIFISKNVFSHKFNYFLHINFFLLLLSLAQVFMMFVVSKSIIDNCHFIFLFFKIIEGFAMGYVYSITQALLTFDTNKRKYKMEITSLMFSVSYSVKIVAPLVAGVITTYLAGDFVLIITAVSSLTSFLIIYSNKEKLFRKYHKLRINTYKHNLNRFEKLNLNFKSFNINTKIFDTYSDFKKMYYLNIFINNSFRNFYDVSLLLIATTSLGFSIIQATSLFSVMVFGQSMSFFTTKIFNKMEHKSVNFYRTLINLMYISLIIGLILLLYIMMYSENKGEYYIPLFVIFFLIGLSRTAFAFWQEYYFYKLIQLEPQYIIDYNANKFIISEYGHFAGYILASISLLIGFKTLIIQILILTIVQNILSFKTDDSCLKQ